MKTLILCFAASLFLAACGGGGEGASDVTPITVALLGDSTQYGTDGSNHQQAPNNPGARLQADMDARFGQGRVLVTDYGVPGTVAKDAPKIHADIIVANYGINDMTRLSLVDYKRYMADIHANIIETHSPIDQSIVDKATQDLYAGSAAQDPSQVADVYSYVLSLPNWQSLLGDGVHPVDALYVGIVDNVLAPAVGKLVEKKLAGG